MRNAWVPLALAAVWLALPHSASAAVTEVTVAKGHHLYGVRQKLFKQTKKATQHTISATTLTAPTQEDLQRLEAGNFSELGNGYYQFDLFAHSTASVGTYTIAFYDHTTQKAGQSCRKLPNDLTVYVGDLAVIYVGFRSASTPSLLIKHAVLPEDLDITAPEWWNGVRNWPAAHIRASGTKSIKVKLFGPTDYECTVDATGSWTVNSKAVTFDSTGVYVGEFTISPSMPSTVQIKQFVWQWRATKDGQTTDLNPSSHKVYIVFASPSTSDRYETLYQFGCDWATGHSTASGTFSAIWQKVATRSALGYTYWPKPVDPNEVNYSSEPDTTKYMPRYFTTRHLIIYGSGRCGAFQDLFVDLLGVQGITVAGVGVHPVPPRRWMRTELQAQGGSPAQKVWKDHAICQYEGVYYDPSYGTTAGSLLEWEDSAIGKYSDDLGLYPPDDASWYDNTIGGTSEVQ